MYTILVLDVEECCLADVYSDGEIKVLYQDTSLVPKKMRVGGQSAKRFAQIRENEVIAWFKTINEVLMTVERDKIHLGISFVYKNQFINLLHTYNKAKIGIIRKTEYTNISGIYQFVSNLEAEKNGSIDED